MVMCINYPHLGWKCPVYPWKYLKDLALLPMNLWQGKLLLRVQQAPFHGHRAYNPCTFFFMDRPQHMTELVIWGGDTLVPYEGPNFRVRFLGWPGQNVEEGHF